MRIDASHREPGQRPGPECYACALTVGLMVPSAVNN